MHTRGVPSRRQLSRQPGEANAVKQQKICTAAGAAGDSGWGLSCPLGRDGSCGRRSTEARELGGVDAAGVPRWRVAERRGRFLQEHPVFSFARPRIPPFLYVFVVKSVAARSFRGLFAATGGIEAGVRKGGNTA